MSLAGCDGALSTVDPAGPAARSIATLWWVMLAGAAAILVLVLALVTLSFRRRAPGGDDDGPRERTFIVALGIAFPAVVLALLLGYGLGMGERLLPREAADVVRVNAEARRWTWSFTYDDIPGRMSESVLHIPAGRPVDVAITTADVIHSFWVPRLAGKLDAIPGRVNRLRIEADAPGTYAGRSAEFSGAGYDDFGFSVVAHDAAGWAAFLRGDAPEGGR